MATSINNRDFGTPPIEFNTAIQNDEEIRSAEQNESNINSTTSKISSAAFNISISSGTRMQERGQRAQFVEERKQRATKDVNRFFANERLSKLHKNDSTTKRTKYAEILGKYSNGLSSKEKNEMSEHIASGFRDASEVIYSDRVNKEFRNSNKMVASETDTALDNTIRRGGNFKDFEKTFDNQNNIIRTIQERNPSAQIDETILKKVISQNAVSKNSLTGYINKYYNTQGRMPPDIAIALSDEKELKKAKLGRFGITNKKGLENFITSSLAKRELYMGLQFESNTIQRETNSFNPRFFSKIDFDNARLGVGSLNTEQSKAFTDLRKQIDSTIKDRSIAEVQGQNVSLNTSNVTSGVIVSIASLSESKAFKSMKLKKLDLVQLENEVKNIGVKAEAKFTQMIYDEAYAKQGTLSDIDILTLTTKARKSILNASVETYVRRLKRKIPRKKGFLESQASADASYDKQVMELEAEASTIRNSINYTY